MTLGVRGAVFDSSGRVLLVRHGYVPGWYLPGGAVEVGETAIGAIARELLEEGGVRLDGPPELFGFYLNRRTSARDHVVLYVCRAWTQTGDPPRNAEIVESGFFDPGALPVGATGGTRRRLAEICDAVTQSAEW
ncbi:MAG: NUDIX domain-containing protein [Hyphomicrobiales bacterium]|nr:NUDIX domain-containing protein [Hyphomicrobiales bacterium]